MTFSASTLTLASLVRSVSASLDDFAHNFNKAVAEALKPKNLKQTFDFAFKVSVALLAFWAFSSFAIGISDTLLGQSTDDGVQKTIKTMQWFLLPLGALSMLGGVIYMLVERGVTKGGIAGLIGGIILVTIGLDAQPIYSKVTSSGAFI